ncbi:hypothetical protein CYMTET_25447 [Cymbomonas tetramitiformis]|uniref:DUF952 domain-containing protein n=1 Tax=Cymbomonas tetramitiformis TaxID=36881 RepID=A0AAE0FTS6_9CHLO|nr:hypothetical protein CYMTET_25447 [Cymbomonas tetramitiformis]|eukprot:gene21191-25456_t
MVFPTVSGEDAGRWAPTGLGDGTHAHSVPKRVFKLAIQEEVTAFNKSGKIESSLDATDGFIHLSDNVSARVVAKLFFTKATDLRLIELDAQKFEGPIQWIIGKMGDAQPDRKVLDRAKTTIHFLRSDGCVHVYGGVSTKWIVREEAVPLGADGVHIFPEWLDAM